MPSFVHGKGIKVLCNAMNLSQILNDATVTTTVDTAETTVFGDNDKTYIVGMRDAVANFGGLIDRSTAGRVQDVVQNALGNASAQNWTVGVEGDSVGSNAKLFQAFGNNFEVSSPVAGVVGVSIAVQVTDRADFGTWHKALGARTSTGTSASVDSGITAGTTAGGVAHLHITAQSTLTTGLTVKVQHSSAGAVWTDLITFSAATSTGSQRSVATGAVKRYTRETASGLVGGAGKSATYAVAFARRVR